MSHLSPLNFLDLSYDIEKAAEFKKITHLPFSQNKKRLNVTLSLCQSLSNNNLTGNTRRHQVARGHELARCRKKEDSTRAKALKLGMLHL